MAERVLIVDDNPFNVKLARYLLTAEGFDVRVAENAEEALTVIASWAPELVLMDLRLPGTDGLALTRTLRANPANHGVAIIAFSAEATKEEERSALGAGCNGYISKPIDTRTFAATVRCHLGPTARSSTLSDNLRHDS
jgi:two-component system, cell cycle response regulator DivK